MFNRKFKLIGTAVGLVAVLVIVLALPSMTQQDNPFARSNIVKMLQNQFAAITAAQWELIDFESAVLWSDGDPKPRLVAYIPPHPMSDFLPLVRQLLAGEKVEVPLGGLWVGEDPTGFLPPGAYKIRLRGDEKVIFINHAGEEVRTIPARIDRSSHVPNKITFHLTVITSNPSKCWRVRIGPVEVESHASWD